MYEFFKQNFFKFIFIFVLFNSLSISFFLYKEKEFNKVINISLSYELLSLIKTLNDFTHIYLGHRVNNVNGADQFDQLYFILRNEKSFLKNDIKIVIKEPEQKLPVYDLRKILIIANSTNKDDLSLSMDEYINNSIYKFRLGLISELISKSLMLKTVEESSVLNKSYISNNHFYSIIFNSKNLAEYINEIKLVETSPIDNLESDKNYKQLIFYLLLSSVFSIILITLYSSLKMKTK